MEAKKDLERIIDRIKGNIRQLRNMPAGKDREKLLSQTVEDSEEYYQLTKQYFRQYDYTPK